MAHTRRSFAWNLDNIRRFSDVLDPLGSLRPNRHHFAIWYHASGLPGYQGFTACGPQL